MTAGLPPLDRPLLVTGIVLLALPLLAARGEWSLLPALPWPDLLAMVGLMLLVAAWRPWPRSYPLWGAAGLLAYKLGALASGSMHWAEADLGPSLLGMVFAGAVILLRRRSVP